MEEDPRVKVPATATPPPPAPPRRPLGVLLVDDHAEYHHAAYLASVASFLRQLPDVRVVGMAANGPEAIRFTRLLAPDLVLLDLTMPGMDALATARILKGLPAAPWVVIVTAFATQSCRLAVAECGADGLVTKADLSAELPALLARFGQLAARDGLEHLPFSRALLARFGQLAAMGNVLRALARPWPCSIKGLATTLGLSLVLVGWLGWNAWAARRVAETLQQDGLRFAELRGEILRLDEVLTMSARMAAATGDAQWEQRYRQHEGQLDRGLSACLKLAAGTPAATPSALTLAAHDQFVAWAHEAFALVAAGQRTEAAARLNSADYAAQQRTYTEGMARAMSLVGAQLGGALERERRQVAWAWLGATAAGWLTLLAWLELTRRLRRRQQELETALAALGETQGELLSIRQELEQRVMDVTAELERGYQQLVDEVKERHVAEAARATAGALCQSLVDGLPLGVIRKDLAGRFVFGNERFCQAVGQPWTVIAGSTDAAFFSAELAEKYRREDAQVLRDGVSFEAVELHFWPDGVARYVHVIKTPVRDAAGEIVGLQGVFADVTARHLAERALRESEHRFRQLVETLPAAIYTCDATGRITHYNQAAVKLWGRAPDLERELWCGSWRMCQPDGTPVPLEDCPMAVTLRTGQPVRGHEVLIERPDGTQSYVLPQAVAIFDTVGTLTGGVKIMLDLTDRHQAEVALRQAEAKYRAIFDHAVEGILQTSIEGRLITANPALAQMLGYATPADLLAAELLMPRDVYVDPADHAELQRRIHLSKLKDGFRCQFRQRDGTKISVSLNARVVLDAAGAPQFYEGTCVDITANCQLEQQLRHAQQMEAIGQLAGGIAHDFNNILAAILSNVELAGLIPPADPGLQECLATIRSASLRAARLVQQILAFSRRQEQNRQPIQLHLILREAFKLLRATVPTAIEFHTSFPVTATVLADPTQIHQIAMNLGTNAWHAMRDQPTGQLRVGLSEIVVDEALAGLHPDLRPGRYLHWTVADTGCGMDAATQRRIFEPFFTTKALGEGTGLGLSVVHGIVKNHDGAITCESQPGEGTRFNLYFPVFETETTVPDDEVAPIPRGRGERILLVDDEVPLVNVGRQMLTRLGYQVTTHTQPGAALAEFAQAPGAFDLVITDLNMPGMSGLELASKLLGHRPGLPIVLTTGYSATLTPETARALGLRELLPKPADFRTLAEVVHRVLPLPASEA